MRIFQTIFMLAALIGFHSSAMQADELSATDFFKGKENWKMVFPSGVSVKDEIVPNAADGTPALRIEVLETSAQSWEGRAFFTIDLPAGDYEIQFLLKAEPVPSKVEFSVWSSELPAKLLAPRVNFTADNEWNEFFTSVSLPEAVSSVRLTWGNLAKSSMVFYIANIRITKL